MNTETPKTAKGIKYLEQGEVRSLLKVIREPRDKAIFTVAYYRGLRASEVKLLSIEDYLPDPPPKLKIRRLKSRSVYGGASQPQVFLLSPDEQRVLRKWVRVRGAAPGPLFGSRKHSGISRQQLDSLMRRYGAEAGIPEDRRHMHALRHSIATHLLEQGRGIHEVQDWLGHKNIATTLIYARMTNKTRDRAAEQFYAGFSMLSAPTKSRPNRDLDQAAERIYSQL